MTKQTLHYKISTIDELYDAYLPIIKQGGLMIPTEAEYPLDATLNVSVTLPGEKTPLDFKGKVVWITPRDLQNQKCGVGVQFCEPHANEIRNHIEMKLEKEELQKLKEKQVERS